MRLLHVYCAALNGPTMTFSLAIFSADTYVIMCDVCHQLGISSYVQSGQSFGGGVRGWLVRVVVVASVMSLKHSVNEHFEYAHLVCARRWMKLVSAVPLRPWPKTRTPCDDNDAVGGCIQLYFIYAVSCR